MVRDQIMPSRGESPFDDDTRMGGTKDLPAVAPRRKPRLDSPANQARLSKLREWLEQENRRQSANRYQMAIDARRLTGCWERNAEQGLTIRCCRDARRKPIWRRSRPSSSSTSRT